MDHLPTASLDVLRRRSELLSSIRRFFDARGFWEVETPLLSHDTVVDRHIDPIPVTLFGDPRLPLEGQTMWLQTSPEFGMKRILAAGAQAIYQVTRSFRGGETGTLHNPEFSMLEWYRVGDDYTAGMSLLRELCRELLPQWPPCESLTYRDAFVRFTQLDPLEAPIRDIRQVARTQCAAVPESLEESDRDSWLDLLMSELVSPRLGHDAPTIVFDFPASQAALARVSHTTPPVAERYELFLRGMEIANGYHELLEASVLRQRMTDANQDRRRDGKYPLPENSRLLAAMDHGIAPCSGVALGVDRLLMVLTGKNRISDVIAFPIDRA